MRLRDACLFVCLSIVATATACSRDPNRPLKVMPAETAASEDDSPSAVAERSQGNTHIVYAQLGAVRNAAGVLSAPKTEFGAGEPVLAMASFEGKGTRQSAGVSVSDAGGNAVSSHQQRFSVEGQAFVSFDIAPEGLAPGDYKALFTCNGAPCWEIPFKVR